MTPDARIYVAGHRGLVGAAIVRKLRSVGYDNLVVRTSDELDLRDQRAVAEFFRQERPAFVFLAAARVGGIVANSSCPAEFIYDNLMIEANVIHAAWEAGVERLLFLGSTCIYPKLAPQPLKEEYLLTGPLEPTNSPYAVAKIAGVEMCRAYNRQYGTRFLAAMPTNLYGPGDNFDLTTSHVLPALIRKFYEAKMGSRDAGLGPGPTPHVTVWGSGTPLREFLYVDDLADACQFLMDLPEEPYAALLADPVAPALVNVGSGEELSIRELALLVKEVVGFEGELVFDPEKPDGTPRKLTDVSRLRGLGWRHRVALGEGVARAYRWYRDSVERAREQGDEQ